MERQQSRWGLRGKTFWNWLELLVVPIALVLIGLAFSARQDALQQRLEDQRVEREQKLADQRAQDTALQAYLDQMGELLIEKDLRDAKIGSEVRTLAQTRTLTVLRQLDADHKTQVMQFLIDDRLVQGEVKLDKKGQLVGARYPVISLDRADLRGVDLRGNDLKRAPVGVSVQVYLTDLTGVQLNYADLSGANLSGALLDVADLTGANLSCADLSHTTLYKSVLTGSNLTNAKGIAERSHYLGHQSFKLAGATMPNGQRYENWLKNKKDLKPTVKACDTP